MLRNGVSETAPHTRTIHRAGGRRSEGMPWPAVPLAYSLLLCTPP